MSGDLLTPGEVLNLVQFPQSLSRDERDAAVRTLTRVRVDNTVQLFESPAVKRSALRSRANGAVATPLQIWHSVERPAAP